MSETIEFDNRFTTLIMKEEELKTVEQRIKMLKEDEEQSGLLNQIATELRTEIETLKFEMHLKLPDTDQIPDATSPKWQMKSIDNHTRKI